MYYLNKLQFSAFFCFFMALIVIFHSFGQQENQLSVPILKNDKDPKIHMIFENQCCKSCVENYAFKYEDRKISNIRKFTHNHCRSYDIECRVQDNQKNILLFLHESYSEGIIPQSLYVQNPQNMNMILKFFAGCDKNCLSHFANSLNQSAKNLHKKGLIRWFYRASLDHNLNHVIVRLNLSHPIDLMELIEFSRSEGYHLEKVFFLNTQET